MSLDTRNLAMILTDFSVVAHCLLGMRIDMRSTNRSMGMGRRATMCSTDVKGKVGMARGVGEAVEDKDKTDFVFQE